MSLGSAPRQGDVFRSTTEFCEPRVRSNWIYAPAPPGVLRRSPPTSCSRICSPTSAGGASRQLIVAVVIGPPAPRGPVRSRGGRAVHVRRALEVRRRRVCRSTTRASPTPCSSTCAPGWPVPSDPSGSSSGRSRSRGGRALGVRRVLDSTPLYDAGRDDGHGHPRPLGDPRPARRGPRGARPALRRPAPPRRRLPDSGKPACD